MMSVMSIFCGRTSLLRSSTSVAVRMFSNSHHHKEPLVKIERLDKGIAVVTLNDPEKLNALTPEMGHEFEEHMKKLKLDQDLRAMILTGSGRAFSAGGDLNMLRYKTNLSPSENSAIMHGFYLKYLCLRKVNVPTIAAINGPAIGAGMCLALACDFRVAAKTAKLGFTFANIGIHPGMGASHFLPRIVGDEVAYRLLLTGEIVTGEQAEDMKLVAKAVPGEEVMEDAMKLALYMEKHSAPLAVRTTVRSLRVQQDQGLEEALCREADAQALCYASEDFKEGVTAIQERRQPEFQGK